MKILYISHQREDSGYGRSCRDYLQALKTTGVEISSVPVVLGKPGHFQDETEKVSMRDCDAVIQHVLPHHMSYNSNLGKNVGICLNETLDCDSNYWQPHLDMMDEVWYPYKLYGGISNKQRTIPNPVDTDIYARTYPKMNIIEANGTYKFYWIGEASKRKNLSALLMAYLSTFTHSDPVSLVIKVHKSGYSNEQAKQEIDALVEKTAAGLRLCPVEDYPRVFVIADYWAEDQIYALHNLCDCYVSSSYGEAVCYPMIDAMGFNNPVICSNNHSAYYGKYGYMRVVSSMEEKCYGHMDAFDGHFTARDSWKAVDIQELGMAMQYEYNNRIKPENDVSGLSYANVGKLMLERLV